MLAEVSWRLLFVLLVVLQGMDVFATQTIIGLGAVEANPTMNTVLAAGGFGALVVCKAVPTVLLLVCFRRWHAVRMRTLILLPLVGVYLVVVVHTAIGIHALHNI